jgi:hypothetical protein
MTDFSIKNITGEFDNPVPSKGMTFDSYFALHVIHDGIIIPYEMKKMLQKNIKKANDVKSVLTTDRFGFISKVSSVPFPFLF